MQDLDVLVNSVVQQRYRFVSRIGKGGTGEVYLVEHTIVGRRYALKVLNKKLVKNPIVSARFHLEPRAAAAVGNPHIVEVVDMGYLDNDLPFIVMELLEGRDLRTELLEEGSFSIGRAIGIATQCCEALEATHKKRIIHRDIKPENIFITKREDGSDFIKILDFGISKVMEAASVPKNERLTWSSAVLGTPRYMSLEQLNGCDDIDARTDVYATGVVLFEMLTGHVPFEAPRFTELVTKITNEPIPPLAKWRPDIPQELEKAIHRSLAKERQERFGSMAEMAEALSPFAGNTSRSIISTETRSVSTHPGIGVPIPNERAQSPQGAPDISTGPTSQVDRDSARGSTLPGLGPPSDAPSAPTNLEDAIITTEIPTTRHSKTKVRIMEGLVAAIAVGASIYFALVYSNDRGNTIENHSEARNGSVNTDSPKAPTDENPAPKAHASANGLPPTQTSTPQADSQRFTTKLKREVERQNSASDSSKAFQGHKKHQKHSIAGQASAVKPLRYQPNRIGRARSKSRVNVVVRRPSTKRQPINTKQRNVTLSNRVRATVKVAVKCKSKSTTVAVSPRNRINVLIPAERCRVSCTGMGRPACPSYIGANTLSLEIR